MASSVSGQDELNYRALCFATRGGSLARSGLPVLSCEKKFLETHVINPLLTNLVRSRWLDIDYVHFLLVYGPRLRLAP